MKKEFKAKFKFVQDNGVVIFPTLTLEAELSDDGNFAAHGDITIRGKWVQGGQCLGAPEFVAWGKRDKNIADLLEIWKVWHLNYLHAGTEKQEAWLHAHGYDNWANEYDKTCKALKRAGLLVDDGYEFGTGWLKREIPADVKARIRELLG